MTLNDAYLRLKGAGVENALGESRLLFAHFTGLPASRLVDRSTECSSNDLELAVERRCNGEPLQYLLGQVDFYREKYLLTKDVLIPRADTEILVDYAVKHIPRGELFFDLCTGSGCIAVSVLNNTESTRCYACDVSREAVEVASGNAAANGVSDRLTLDVCDLMSDFPDGSRAAPYAILCNPPYISREVYEGLAREIFFEPRRAFVGGEDGLLFYKRLLPLCARSIKPIGFVAFEIGYDQADALKHLAEENGCSCEIIKDYAGQDRVAVIKRKASIPLSPT